MGREELRPSGHQGMVPPLQSSESFVSTAGSEHETLEDTAGAGAGAGLSLQL